MSNVCDPSPIETASHQYLARDGLYYNGYAASYDCAEDYFGPAWKKIAEALEREIKEAE